MNRTSLFIYLIILFVTGFIPSTGQEMTDRDYQRWLIKKPIIKNIDVEIESQNSSYFSEGKIKRSLFSRESSLLRAIKADRSRRVQRETLSRDTSAVKFLFLSKGFLGVQIKETFEPIMETGKELKPARVKISIKEGNQFEYNEINIQGNFPEQFRDKFFSEIRRFKKGREVNPFDLRQAIYDIKSILANNGYPYARAEYYIDTSLNDSLANITLNINSDTLVHFGEVNISGAEKYDLKAVKRELTFMKGDIYRRRAILKSQKRLLGTGYFITMRLESAVTDSSSEYERLNPNFNLFLKERNPHYVSIKTGAAQDTIPDLIWHVGVSWGKRNFLGSRQLELSANSKFKIINGFALKEHNYQVSLTEPWLLGIKMPLTLVGKYEPGVQSLVQYYSKQTWSISVLTVKNFGEKLKVTAGLQYVQLVIYNVDTSKYDTKENLEEIIMAEEGLSVRRKLYVNLLRDRRNSIFIPSTGSVVSLRFEYIGGFLGGGESFYVGEASWSRYQEIWKGLIYASRFRGGVIQEFGQATSVPVDDRFYIGGANTIRGFSEKELGPKTGSDIIFITNHELRFPLIGKLWMSVFSDIGNGFMRRSEIKLDNLVVTAGMGIQFISPAGPIRLDYAQQIEKANTDTGKDYRWHFTILYAF
ncbi:MAG: BamA/TamA family outer membrane protein [Candidatus Zixiibacteriota bacterium]